MENSGFDAFMASYFLYFVVLGLSIWYMYKASEQIRKKKIDFFKQEIFTEDSVKKWAVTDGILKLCCALTFMVYAGLGLVDIDIIYVVPAVVVVLLVLYFVLFKKTLVKKEILE